MRILVLLSFFCAFSLSLSAQCNWVYSFEENTLNYNCDNNNPPDDLLDLSDVVPGEQGGGPSSRITCRTLESVISVTTFNCGSGQATEAQIRYTCVAGNRGVCQVGTAYLTSGCEDGELFGDENGGGNVQTIVCN